MAYSNNAREEEIKNRLRKDYFAAYDAEHVLGDIDFAVAVPTRGPELFETEYLLWAEAKKGTSHDIYESLVQLILTIGKARTFDHVLPPAFLGAFDAAKIAFIPYNAVLDIFYQNDFNWNVTPSDHTTKEFRLVMQKVRATLEHEMLVFSFDNDDRELRQFIRANFKLGKAAVAKVRINKNNFTAIYQKWLAEVKPSIAVNWETAKKRGIIDADFYLADILSEHNVTLRPKLYVLLRTNYYELDRRIDDTGLWDSKKAEFNDRQVAHTQFWNRYERPPRREYWDYIVERRDLLVPQDVRERKGSFFTPRRWVELSQQYIAAELGENWQDEYYIWDCCGGTGNLEAGLTNKYHIWVSTLDKADVDVMHDRIRHMNEASASGQGANLLDSHVFQFDFLNDPFCLDNPAESKLPRSLIDVLANEEKRRHLVIYINPPYAEAGDTRQLSGTGKNKTDVAVNTKIYKKSLPVMGIAGRELFAQFVVRIYKEIPCCILGMFSKLKNLQAPNFKQFRQYVTASPDKVFLVPSSTFDNVKGNFPIAFSVYDLSVKQVFKWIKADVYDKDGNYIGQKSIYSYDEGKGNIGSWVLSYKDDNGLRLGFMSNGRNDFQNQKLVYIINKKEQMPTPRGWWITPNNLIVMSIFLAVRKVIPATWLNDRDQFLYPNDGWKKDFEFQADCLVYTLFNNNIQSRYGTNHWIPFTEEEVGAQETFDSHFMSDFLRGKPAACKSLDAPLSPHCARGGKCAGTQATTQPTNNKPNNGVGSSQDRPLQAAPVEQSLFAAAPPAAKSPSTIGDGWRGAAPMDCMSAEAKAVMDAGRRLWSYYHWQAALTTGPTQKEGAAYNPNASLYDIRLHFQGYKTTKSGKVQMNTESPDAKYTQLIADLRQSLKALAGHIAPKVYDYGFLLK